MSMASLRLYKNPYSYPDYGSISAVGSSMPCTPVGTGLKTGTIKVKGSMADFMNCNYLALTRSGETIYAWIEDVTFSTANSFTVDYRVDAWRTYRSKISLGQQFIERSPRVTNKVDDLLGADSDIKDITSTEIVNSADRRFLVVQIRDYPESGAGVISDTPVQPTPYRILVKEYNPEQWNSDASLKSFLRTVAQNPQTNIVTMYSVPYVSRALLGDNTSFRITTPDGDEHLATSTQWKDFDPVAGVNHELVTQRIFIANRHYDVDELERKNGQISLVIPGAGVMNIPLELLKKPPIYLRRDVDILSGGSNFMLEADGELYDLSVRGSGVSSIPVLSDAMETYISQNQNALTTAMIGDVATIATGATVALATGGIGAGLGASGIGAGINNIISRHNAIKDSGSRQTSPTAMLGTALEGAFHGKFWLVTTTNRVDNEALVHSNYGYPLNKVDNLTFPNSGYIKTQGCNVSSDGTVPRWAIEEINQMFNNGVSVK